MGEDAGEFGLPVSLLVTGDLGEVGEGLVQGGVDVAQGGEEIVAKAVAGEGGVPVGLVLLPGLAGGVEEVQDLGA